MFSGWGIRTLSADHAAFDPLAYQNGSVWPFDNALIVSGLRRYGEDAPALPITDRTISLALATMAGVHLLGADEILAAFVAGAVLNNVNRQAKVEEHHELFATAPADAPARETVTS